jgi:SAM-dependent methyltransferase
MKYPEMDQIYHNFPPDNLPWNIATPPEVLVDLVESGRVLPCRAVDFGCGAGNYAIYLAGRGFDMTGVDISPAAIRIATENAKKRGVQCRFIVADLLGDLHEIQETFDFAYDWELLHHVFPDDRKRYIRNVLAVLKPGGLYLTVSFSEEDPQFGGTGKFRSTRIGTTLYFSSEAEIRDLISPYFTIRELKTIDIYGKTGPHRAVRALAERR